MLNHISGKISLFDNRPSEAGAAKQIARLRNCLFNIYGSPLFGVGRNDFMWEA